MTTDVTAPANKQDLLDFMKHISKQIDELYRANECWKNELKLHFDVTVEKFEDAVRTINLEKIVEHSHRIARMETHTGLARSA